MTTAYTILQERQSWTQMAPRAVVLELWLRNSCGFQRDLRPVLRSQAAGGRL